jgi:hypothetical protein
MRSLLFQASILPHYWVEGFHIATYLLNRLPTKSISETSPNVTLHRVAPTYEHLCMFICACYPNLSAKAAHKVALKSTRCVFPRYYANHKGYQCLDLTTNNIVVFPHVVFDEADSPFSASSRLTNDLIFFLQDDDSLGAGPMPTPLPVPCIPSGFLPHVIAGNKTARLGSQTTTRTDAGGPTVRPGKQTTLGTEASGLTMQPSGPSAPWD